LGDFTVNPQHFISIARDFSPTPGGRYIQDGAFSGESFRDTLVEPRFAEAVRVGSKLWIDVDGTAGYATSFLEETFGGLVRDLGKKISDRIVIVTDNPLRKREIEGYITDAEAKLK
jgi:hypothetical protein